MYLTPTIENQIIWKMKWKASDKVPTRSIVKLID